MTFHAQSHWSVRRLPVASEDMSPIHDVLRNKRNFLYNVGQENPESVLASISEGLRVSQESLLPSRQ